MSQKIKNKARQARQERQKQEATRKNRKTRRRRQRQQAETTVPREKEEHHHFYSKMVFDGNNVTTETQKDDEPIQRHVYTMKQLEQEIPIGAELLRNENIKTVPPALQYPISRELGFRNVLPNPADLGLLPPRVTSSNSSDIYDHNQPHSHSHNRSRSRRMRLSRGLGLGRIPRYQENLKLVVKDPYTRTPPRDIFHLPV